MTEPIVAEKPSYLIVNEKTSSSEAVEWARNLLDHYIQKEQDEAIAFSSEIPEEILQFAEQLFSFIQQFEKSWGVEEHIPDVVLNISNESLESIERNVAGADILSRVLYLSNEPTGYEDKDPQLKDVTRQIHLAELQKRIAHEMHHFLGRKILSLEFQDPEAPTIKAEREGLLYYHKGKKGNAIEEGLSVLFEDSAKENLKLLDDSPLASIMEERVVVDYKSMGLITPDIPEESIQVDVAKGKFEVSVAYPKSVVLTKFLIEKVPDFVSLAEQARIDQKVLPLVRAIEKIFGPVTLEERTSEDDPYQRIVMATEETAEETLQYLSKKLIKN